MKIEAYKCDFCKKIYEGEEINGLSTQVDMFDVVKSFPVSVHPEKCLIHFCLECYRVNVLNPATLIDRKKHETDYKLRLEQLTYIFKKQVIDSARLDKKNKGKN